MTRKRRTTNEHLGPLFSRTCAPDPSDVWRGVYYFHGWADRDFWPWLAAFIDGEGNISRPKKTGLVLSIANTDRDVIESIRRRLGLGYLEIVTTDNPRWKTKWVWRLARYEDVRRVLLYVRPYLTIKAKAADAAVVRIATSVQRTSTRHARYEALLAALAQGTTEREVGRAFGVTRGVITSAKWWAKHERVVRTVPADRRYRSSGNKKAATVKTKSQRLS